MNLFSKFRILLLSVTLGVSGCATSDPALWPPVPGTLTKEIYVSLDTWHAMIGFQKEMKQDQQNNSLESLAPIPLPVPVMYVEWGYAEKSWYLEGQQGMTGVLRALFWPSEGVVEVSEHDQLWADRTLQPPSDLFKFELSEGGYNRLRAHLRTTKASLNPVTAHTKSVFYRATDAYHVFHHCHHYVARALQRAGLPISTFWAITRTGLANQLQEVQESIKERMSTF